MDRVAEIMGLVSEYGGECGDCALAGYGTERWKRIDVTRKEAWNEVQAAVAALVAENDRMRAVVDTSIARYQARRSGKASDVGRPESEIAQTHDRWRDAVAAYMADSAAQSGEPR